MIMKIYFSGIRWKRGGLEGVMYFVLESLNYAQWNKELLLF